MVKLLIHIEAFRQEGRPPPAFMLQSLGIQARRLGEAATTEIGIVPDSDPIFARASELRETCLCLDFDYELWNKISRGVYDLIVCTNFRADECVLPDGRSLTLGGLSFGDFLSFLQGE